MIASVAVILISSRLGRRRGRPFPRGRARRAWRRPTGDGRCPG